MEQNNWFQLMNNFQQQVFGLQQKCNEYANENILLKEEVNRLKNIELAKDRDIHKLDRKIEISNFLIRDEKEKGREISTQTGELGKCEFKEYFVKGSQMSNYLSTLIDDTIRDKNLGVTPNSTKEEISISKRKRGRAARTIIYALGYQTHDIKEEMVARVRQRISKTMANRKYDKKVG